MLRDGSAIARQKGDVEARFVWRRRKRGRQEIRGPGPGPGPGQTQCQCANDDVFGFAIRKELFPEDQHPHYSRAAAHPSLPTAHRPPLAFK